MSTHLNAQNNRLTINVTALKNSQGQVIIDIFNNDNGYPMKTENAILRKKLTIPEDGNVVFYIDGLEKGEYAFALIHDENSNNKLDLNFIGIPKEGAGASNNAKGIMGPPDYKDAKFNFNKSKEVTIKMLYF
jgi:uncharacterized protein (DUF2141 family)